jgi:hypothetical protein
MNGSLYFSVRLSLAIALAQGSLTACVTGPELPARDTVGPVILSASVEVVRTNPTAIKLVATAFNPTAQPVELLLIIPACSVLPRIYGPNKPTGQLLLPPGANSCAAAQYHMTLDPGETKRLPDEPEFVLSERLENFVPGRYHIAAVISASVEGGTPRDVEIHAGDVEVRD